MVELNGEGYFEVTKNAKKPFIVKTQLFNIQVLGTRFNVFAYAGKESKFETCLVEGRVLVYNKNNKNEKVYLNPHEKVSLVNNRMVVSTSNFDNEEYLKSGIFSFRSKPFGENPELSDPMVQCAIQFYRRRETGRTNLRQNPTKRRCG